MVQIHFFIMISLKLASNLEGKVTENVNELRRIELEEAEV
jgi:hypothetical protein